MEKRISYSGVAIILLIVAIVAMSIGFAVFSSNLKINGSATVSSSSWKVEFDPATLEVTEGSVSATEPSINATTATYTVTLAKPGDFYEFTVDVKNLGTFDANLTSVTMSDISQHSKYLTYSVTYGSQSPYTQTTSGLSLPLAAESGVETVKVRVEYVQPADSTDLPATEQQVTLNTTLLYEQATA